MLFVSMVGFVALAVLAAVRLRGPGRAPVAVGFGVLAIGPLVQSVFLLLTPTAVAVAVGGNVTWVAGWICVAVGVIRAWRASRAVQPPVPAPAQPWR